MYGDQVMLICINTVFTAIALISTGLRAIACRARRARPQSDDILAYLAMFFNIGQVVIVYLMVLHGGAGKPSDKTTDAETAYFDKLTTIVQLFYGLTMGGTRASIVCLEMQIFKFTKWMKWICRVNLGLIACWTIYTIIQTFAMCRPYAANWDKSIKGAHCGDELASLLGIVIYGLILDLIIFITPMPRIWKLQMPLKQKIAITLLFAIGLFDIVTGVMRMVVTVEGVFDIVTESLVWATLEPAVAIWVANLPKCRKSFDVLIPKEIFSHLSIQSLLGSRRSARSVDKKLDSEQTSMSEQSQWDRPQMVFDYPAGQRGSGYRSSAHHVPGEVPLAVPEGQVTVQRDFDTYSEKAEPAPLV